jgi:hypothetical protein
MKWKFRNAKLTKTLMIRCMWTLSSLSGFDMGPDATSRLAKLLRYKFATVPEFLMRRS